MSAPADLVNEMQAIGAVIRHARSDLDAGHSIDVGPLEARVNTLCDRLASAPAKDGDALRPGVLALLDDVGQLARRIDTRLDELRKDLQETGGRSRALTAYGKAARPDKPKR